MKLSELPEDFKKYTLILSNKSEYQVTGKQKEIITKNNSGFVELPNGSIINKAFIIEFKLDIDETRNFVTNNKDKIIKQ